MKLKCIFCRCRPLARCVPPRWCSFSSHWKGYIETWKLLVPLARFTYKLWMTTDFWFTDFPTEKCAMFQKRIWGERISSISILSLEFNYSYRKCKRVLREDSCPGCAFLSTNNWQHLAMLTWTMLASPWPWQGTPLKKLIAFLAPWATHTKLSKFFIKIL